MEEIVKVTWFFKGTAPKEEVEEFFKDWIDDGYILMEDMELVDVDDTDEKVWVILFSTTRDNFNAFKEDFGEFTTIQEGW